MKVRVTDRLRVAVQKRWRGKQMQKQRETTSEHTKNREINIKT